MKPDALRGHLGSLILAVVEAEPMHGYGIAEALQQRSSGLIDLPTGTLYPALRRLESQGYVRSTWTASNGRQRRTYEITSSGQAALAADRKEFDNVTRVLAIILHGSS
jgi:DNA-binding PadR family transcriptional regulator